MAIAMTIGIRLFIVAGETEPRLIVALDQKRLIPVAHGPEIMHIVAARTPHHIDARTKKLDPVGFRGSQRMQAAGRATILGIGRIISKADGVVVFQGVRAIHDLG